MIVTLLLDGSLFITVHIVYINVEFLKIILRKDKCQNSLQFLIVSSGASDQFPVFY